MLFVRAVSVLGLGKEGWNMDTPLTKNMGY